MVDRTRFAGKAAAIEDAVQRIEEVLPPDEDAFLEDRTAREVVALNLMVAIQQAIDLAAHWIADEGWEVPGQYGETFSELADRGVISAELARKLAGAAGFRNLIAHRYGRLDWRMVYAIARDETKALLAFPAALAKRMA